MSKINMRRCGCGEKPMIIGNNGLYSAICYGCFLQSAVKDAPEKTAASWNRALSNWTPCSEKMPNVDQDVMLWMRGCYVDIGHLTSYGMWSIDIIDYDIKDATHWMQLPEPPEEAGKEYYAKSCS